jgi:predicted unusual protein kinase regulating ubiquinone biosynthesis (AarF/ABC1/UbiB family)
MLRARYRRIVWFFARLLLSFILWDLILPRLGLRSRAERNRPKRLQRSAAALRTLAIQMGGVLIKVGQFLSSRVDVLPPAFTDELQGLQDEVPPEPFADIYQLVEAEFGMPVEMKFSSFDEKPLAAASLGQVHCARLRIDAPAPGEEDADQPPDAYDVVVKVQRLNIERIIETDLAALRTVGRWLNRYRPIRKRANVPLLLDEFTRTLYEEIDYLAEGRNAETFAANFRHDRSVRVPQVIWTHTTRRVLTLENVLAIKITDYEGITAAGISRADVASRLLATYLKQIFEDGFFHADPHPGNLFVNPLPARGGDAKRRDHEWELTFVDFGMVGTVPPNLRNGLREMLIGVGMQDAARVVKSYQMMDVLLPSADLARIEFAGTKVFERYWGKNMSELSAISTQEMKDFADEFRDLIYDMPFQIPQNLVFLGRCVGILSGMCTGLDPQFNLWDNLAPFAQKLMADEIRTGREFWLGELESLARATLSVPRRMDSMLSKLERGEIAVRAPEVSQQVQRIEHGVRRITTSIIFTALLLGGIQLLLGGQEIIGAVLLGGAGLNLLWLLRNGMRSGGR